MRIGGQLVTRPARVLLGWLGEEDGCMMLGGRNQRASSDPAHVERSRNAREAVERRKEGLDQTNTISPPPDPIAEHIAALGQTAIGRELAAEGWVVQLADLRKVCALQPSIHYDQARERTADARGDDLASLARISLPLPSDSEIPAQFDPGQKTWVITSRNSNLRIVGNFEVPVAGEGHAFGLVVRVLPSFLQVVRFRDRYVLHDGYHRSLGFLSRGIHVVPVFYKELGPYEELGVQGRILPQEAFLGTRPPVIPDYLAEDVSAEVALPATRRMVVISGIETNPIG